MWGGVGRKDIGQKDAGQEEIKRQDSVLALAKEGIAGVMICLYFRSDKHIRELETQEMQDIDSTR